MVQSQPREIVCKTLSQKSLSQKWADRQAQDVCPEFKPQYHKNKKESRRVPLLNGYRVSLLQDEKYQIPLARGLVHSSA
jgi:hypothetical protein